MNVTLTPRGGSRSALCFVALLLATPAKAQQAPDTTVIARFSATPAQVAMKSGETVPVKITAYDAAGRVIANPAYRVAADRSALQLTSDGLRAIKAGNFEVVITGATTPAGATPTTLTIPVQVTWPAVKRVTLTADPGRLYTGVTLAHRVEAFHGDSTMRPSTQVAIRWTSSNSATASVDRFGNVTAHRAGPVTITAEAEGVKATARYTVAANPVASVDVALDQQAVRTGDVIHLKAVVRTAGGRAVTDAPVTWSYVYTPDDTIAAPGATGVIDPASSPPRPRGATPCWRRSAT